MVILSLPPVDFSTSFANCWMFSVWKLFAGYAVGRSHFGCASAGNASVRATIATKGAKCFIRGSKAIDAGGGSCRLAAFYHRFTGSANDSGNGRSATYNARDGAFRA